MNRYIRCSQCVRMRATIVLLIICWLFIWSLQIVRETKHKISQGVWLKFAPLWLFWQSFLIRSVRFHSKHWQIDRRCAESLKNIDERVSVVTMTCTTRIDLVVFFVRNHETLSIRWEWWKFKIDFGVQNKIYKKHMVFQGFDTTTNKNQ